MPELPEVEAVVRIVRKAAVGRRITSARVYRCAATDLEKAVRGRRILAVERRAKHILMRLSGQITLHTHLRMSGHLRVVSDRQLPTSTARVVLALSGGGALVLEDPRALARMDAVATAAIDARMIRLGPEPLAPEFDAEEFVTAARASRQAAKLFLMNQRRIAGLGNIYAAEALFRAGIDPRRAIGTLSESRLRRLHAAIVQVLEVAVQSAIEAYSGPGLIAESEAFPVAVYDREGESCLICRRVIRRILQGGRSTYFCPGCQH